MKKCILLLSLFFFPVLVFANDLPDQGTVCEVRIFCKSHDVAGTVNDWVLEERRFGEEQKTMLAKYLREGSIVIEPSPVAVSILRIDPSGRVVLVHQINTGQEFWTLMEALNCSGDSSGWSMDSPFLKRLLGKS